MEKTYHNLKKILNNVNKFHLNFDLFIIYQERKTILDDTKH